MAVAGPLALDVWHEPGSNTGELCETGTGIGVCAGKQCDTTGITSAYQRKAKTLHPCDALVAALFAALLMFWGSCQGDLSRRRFVDTCINALR